MKTMLRVTIVFAIVLITACACAQPKGRYSTIIYEYIGEEDSPSFPIIISVSEDEAAWYRQRIYGGQSSALLPVATFTHVYVVTESTMEGLAAIQLRKSDLVRPASDRVAVTAPTLRVILARGHKYMEVTGKAEPSVILLGKTIKLASEKPELVQDVLSIEGRINQFLRTQ